MEFFDIYWTLSGFINCIPLLAISLTGKRKSHYYIKMLCFCIAFLLVNYMFTMLGMIPGNPKHLDILSSFVIQIISIAIFPLCNDWDWKRIFYGKIWGMTVYYISLQAASLIASMADSSAFFQVLFITKMIMVFLISVMVYHLFTKTILKEMTIITLNQLVLAALITIVGVLFNTIIFDYMQSRTPVIYLFQLFSMLVVALSLYLQAMEFQNNYLNTEMSVRRRLWEEQQKQFEFKKEYMDLINQKFHDLKYKISAMRHMSQNQDIQDELDEMSKSMQPYHYLVQTGNHAIDAILTEKAQPLYENGIQFSCIIDNEINVSFIKIMDLYAILGNAMDNVLECMTGDHRPEHGNVNVRIYNDKHFLRIIIKNNYQGEIEFHNGLPVSIKQDMRYHGFGLKSIKQTVKRYDGAISLRTKNHEFILSIMLPIPNTK